MNKNSSGFRFTKETAIIIAGFALDVMGALGAFRGSSEPLPIVGDIHIIG